MPRLTIMCLPTTLQSMLLPFIHPLKSCLEDKAILPVEPSYDEEGENLLRMQILSKTG